MRGRGWLPLQTNVHHVLARGDRWLKREAMSTPVRFQHVRTRTVSLQLYVVGASTNGGLYREGVKCSQAACFKASNAELCKTECTRGDAPGSTPIVWWHVRTAQAGSSCLLTSLTTFNARKTVVSDGHPTCLEGCRPCVQ
jgi:hypothetical protein